MVSIPSVIIICMSNDYYDYIIPHYLYDISFTSFSLYL